MNHSASQSAPAGGATLALASTADARRDYQAYQILHWAFVAAPVLAGIDKFTHVLCDWHKYLAPQFAIFGPHTTMLVVGGVEILAGIGVALKPRWFAPIVALWLWGIIANLLLLGSYYDVALRDFGLSLGALSLWRLAEHFEARTSSRPSQ
jgi:hypothetical protein